MARFRYEYNGQYFDINGMDTRSVRPPRTGYFFGDSFVLGVDGNNAPALTTTPIHETINDMLGMSLVNKGTNGMWWLPNANTNSCAYNVISATDLSTADVCLLAYGIDEMTGVDIGTANDETTVMGQVDKCIRYIYTQKPTCRVILVGPWVQNTVNNYDNQGLMEFSRRELSSAMQTYCTSNLIPFIPMNAGPFNKFNVEQGNGHGLIGTNPYPTERGYILLGQWLAGEISRIIG